MKNRHFLKVGIIILTALILGFIDLPANYQQKIIGTPATSNVGFFDSIRKAILDNKFHLGLDLQGGSQLDYKIDLRKVQTKDQQSIIDGVVNVINDRVNRLGVSEPNIYVSSFDQEKHIIVELAGIKDLEEAKKTVGKTIQLEFKEKKTTVDTNADANAKNGAQDFLKKTKAGTDFAVSGKEEQQANPEKVAYEEIDYSYKNEVQPELADILFNKMKVGEVYDQVVSGTTYTIDSSSQFKTIKGYQVVKLIDKRDQQRTIENNATAKVEHILIAYKGASKADASVTRSKEEAKKFAEELLAKVQKGENFENLAKQYSNDTADKDQGGLLPTPVNGQDDGYVKPFQDAALALKKNGDISPVTETEFGFHIIKGVEIKAASKETKTEPQVKYQTVFYNAAADEWQETGLTGQQFVHADVEFTQYSQPYVTIQFNEDGAKLFEQITERNISQPVAIFVGGKLISSPNVNEKISGGRAQISGNFSLEEANNLARDLNTGAIPAPIVLVGQNTIGASLGQDALTKSLWAGLIGFILVAIFMIVYYRLPGVLAVIALAIYSLIMLFLIKVALPPIWALGTSILVFVYLITRIINSKDSGPEKAISLILTCFILFLLSFLLSTPIVMTLAGIAGVILSIGMAVDANILIFERVKEELRDGRPLSAAIDIGFDRAWSSIRDSNFSSLITCGILFYFGSSIIQGFAFNLAAGILVSMFTAITISKTFITALTKTSLANNLWLFGAPKRADKKLWPIVQKRKLSYIISGALLIAALIGLPVFGLKLGLDFTGGTLMELKFKNLQGEQMEQMAKIEKALEESANSLNQKVVAAPNNNPNQPTLTDAEGKIDLGKPHIVPGQGDFIIKTKNITSDQYDKLIVELQNRLGEIELVHFNTVGPVVGESLRYKAVIAVIVASVMIIIYIAFAFRRIPRHIGKWKFGTAAIVALLHDLGIMLGVYVYFGVLFGVEIDALFITAMLTVLGFSVHDTIVVFDRIREKLKYQKRDESFEDVANQAVNETIARSINTSLAVFLTLLALALFGAESIRFFVLTLIVGIVAGTYSSIFIATPILVDWNLYDAKKKLQGGKKK